MTLSELQTRRDALLEKMANSIQSLSAGDKSVTYQTMASMRTALQTLDSEIAVAQAAAGTTRQSIMRFYTRDGF